MSILASLVRAYARLPNAPPFGFSMEKIGFLIALNADGAPVGLPSDLREGSGKKLVAVPMSVPQPAKRTSGIAPNFLWDKTSYVLGVTAGEGKRTAEEHAAFVARHRKLLAGSEDAGLFALLRFLEGWTPDRFESLGWPEEMKDQNVVFALQSERLNHVRIHDRPAARELWARLAAGEDKTEAICLVTGERGPVARLHPAIKGVWGAQSSGASLVSFNLDAFTSYSHEQGDNAPVSEAAAFAYTTALNRFLERDSKHRIQIGDASTIFWADASNAEAAATAEAVMDAFFGDLPAADESMEANKVRAVLEKIRDGRPMEVAQVAPELIEGVRCFILGLSPNAARLSVRYWLENDFEVFALRLALHHVNLAIEPVPWRSPPSIQRFLVKTTALQEKFDNIPRLLAGEVTRAVLTGARYPRALLAAAIMRLRAGDDPGSGWHAAVIKACINRSLGNTSPPAEHDEPTSEDQSLAAKEKLPVALEPDRENTPYQLGRLFAMLEAAQYAALGRVNAPIGDRYYGAASATPARVFGPLLRGLKNHIADARKRGRGGWIELRVGEIISKLPPDLPRTLRLEDQGRFAVGYYHERATRAPKADNSAETKGENTDE